MWGGGGAQNEEKLSEERMSGESSKGSRMSEKAVEEEKRGMPRKRHRTQMEKSSLQAWGVRRRLSVEGLANHLFFPFCLIV